MFSYLGVVFSNVAKCEDLMECGYSLSLAKDISCSVLELQVLFILRHKKDLLASSMCFFPGKKAGLNTLSPTSSLAHDPSCRVTAGPVSLLWGLSEEGHTAKQQGPKTSSLYSGIQDHFIFSCHLGRWFHAWGFHACSPSQDEVLVYYVSFDRSHSAYWCNWFCCLSPEQK